MLKNSVDSSLSIKTITVAPIVDNVSQIYGKPLTVQMNSIIENDKQWDLRSFSDNIKSSPEEFEDQPSLVRAALKKVGADGLITGRLTKGPNGISIRLNLFSASDGLMLTQETLQDFSGFEIGDVRTQISHMFAKLKGRLPYSGIVLSRKGQLVTVNVGKNHGLQENMDLSVVQIVKLNRHPKFHFIISAEKEIIGRVHIDKVEEALSFGTVVMERSEGVVQPEMKVIPVSFVEYPAVGKTTDGKIIGDLSKRPDSTVSWGDGQPREWVPQTAPSFGKVGVLLGVGTYNVSNNLRSVGGVTGKDSLAPSIHMSGELWLTTNWILGLGLRQYVVSIDNGYSGSSPSSIKISTLQTTLQLGYNFLLADQFYGPKIQVLGGYSKMSASVDGSSPTAYTSMGFGGFAMGLDGSFPVSEEIPLTLGAKMLYFLSPSVDERPVSSGTSSTAQISSFSGYGSYRWTEHMNMRGELMYDLFSASFSGIGSRGTDSATSASHTSTTFAAGIEYLF